MAEYTHQLRVRYCETDQMGVVHHANYLHWLEVARTEYLRQQGVSYSQLEEAGVLLPVSEVNCNYHRPAQYDDLITIIVKIKKLKRVTITFEYQVYNEEELLVTATTVHPFVNHDFKPVSLRQEHPQLWEQIFSEEEL
ncbi:acyl-CoA thioesterase [Halanaerobaculum tunisiense]